jgi:hypothetical protein
MALNKQVVEEYMRRPGIPLDVVYAWDAFLKEIEALPKIPALACFHESSCCANCTQCVEED